MKISLQATCRLCQQGEETLIHLYFSCQESQNIWNRLIEHIKDKLNIDLTLSKNIIILGYLHSDNRAVAINTILLIIITS